MTARSGSLHALLPLLLFPWGWSIRLWRGFSGTWSDPAIKLCTIWATSTLILFSLISGKQAHYLLPAYPAMALLFAYASVRAKSGSMAWVALLLIAAGGRGDWLGPDPCQGRFGTTCALLAADRLRRAVRLAGPA